MAMVGCRAGRCGNSGGDTGVAMGAGLASAGLVL